jgi:hypothetical protein
VRDGSRVANINFYWNGVDTETLILPSGMVVTLKKIELTDLDVDPEADPVPVRRIQDVDIVTAAGWCQAVEDILNFVVKFSMLEPLVVDERDGEHLSLAEIPRLDKIAIWKRARWCEVPRRPPDPSRGNQWRLHATGEAFRKWQSN